MLTMFTDRLTIPSPIELHVISKAFLYSSLNRIYELDGSYDLRNVQGSGTLLWSDGYQVQLQQHPIET